MKVYITKYPLHAALAQNAVNKPRRGWDPFDPNFRHRAVMSLFADFDEQRPRSTYGILFRVDVLPGQEPYFFIQSLTPPVAAGAEVLTIEQDVPEYPASTPVRFRLAVNAVRRLSGEGTQNSTEPVPMDSDTKKPAHISRMTPWLQRKLAPALSGVEIINHQREVLGLDANGRARHGIAVQVDTIDGVGNVVDSGALTQLILNGVGRAKSYGCGLLSVRALA